MRTRSSSRPAGVLGLVGVCGALVGMASLALGGAGAAQPEASRPGIPGSREMWGASFGGERVFTKPKQDAAMGFTLSTQVMEVLCRTGDRVSAGQMLIRGDDREEASRYQQQVHRAETMLQIERARATADLAQVEFDREQRAFDEGAGNELDRDRARLALATARIDVSIAEWSQQQERYLADLTKARVDRFRLVAPFDGIVDVVSVDVGDVVRETDAVVRVVDLSELWIDVPAEPDMVARLGLAPGSDAWVLMELAETPVVTRGRVIEVTPTSDYGASRQRVRVAVTNASGWPSGLVAWVRFTEPGGEWLGRVASGVPAGEGEAGASSEDGR